MTVPTAKEVPFAHLVALDWNNGDTSTAKAWLRDSPWLTGAVSAGLPTPLTILADVTTGLAALLGRPDHERVVTESLRIDVLKPSSSHLEMTGTAAWSGPRKVIVTGTIRDMATDEVVAHALARIAVLDARRPGSPASRQAEQPTNDQQPPTFAELAAQAEERADRTDEAVQLCVPVNPAFGNSYGIMHGGAIAALADLALNRLRREPTVQSLTIDYLAPVSLAQAVEVTAGVALRTAGKAEVRVDVGSGAVARYLLRNR